MRDTLGAMFESRLGDTGTLKLEPYCGYSHNQGFVYSVHNERFSSTRSQFDLLLNVFKNFTSKDLAVVALILDLSKIPAQCRAPQDTRVTVAMYCACKIVCCRRERNHSEKSA